MIPVQHTAPLITSGAVRFRALLAFAVIFLAGAASPWHAAAQSLPGLFYGKDVRPGATVTAAIGGAACGSTTVTAGGEWMLLIPPGACGAASGASVNFAVDGTPRPVTPAAVWQPGGIPPGEALVNGYVLGAAGSGPGGGPSGGAATPTAGAAAGVASSTVSAGNAGSGTRQPGASASPVAVGADSSAPGLRWLTISGVAALIGVAAFLAWRSWLAWRRA